MNQPNAWENKYGWIFWAKKKQHIHNWTILDGKSKVLCKSNYVGGFLLVRLVITCKHKLICIHTADCESKIIT